MLVAWRRLDEVPPDEAQLPWLYATARRCLANQRRGAARRLRLVRRLETTALPDGGLDPADTVSDAATRADEGAMLREALGRLRPDDAELLRLATWEQFDNAQLAACLGISPNAATIRLHRARKRLAAELGEGWR